MTSPHDPHDPDDTATMSFRAALASPCSAYRAVQYSTSDDLDTTLTKTLLDYKRGRQHQAAKRFRNLVMSLGFDATVPLIHQAEKLDETTASLLIFELLFMFKQNIEMTQEQLWQYVDSVALFDPDDVVCHGAIYNMMLVFFLRSNDLTAAFELARLALNAYRRCDSDYLQMFIHLHMAYAHVYAGRLGDAQLALDDAQQSLVRCGRPVCETAMVDITRHWIQAEAEAVLPSVDELHPLGARITEGEFWPETFLVLAALQMRAALAEGHPNPLEHHRSMEFTLRNRGLLPLLPAMQLLREECLPGEGRRPGRQPLALPERQLVLLMPTEETWRLNHGDNGDPAPRLARLRALHEIHLARQWRQRGRFDLVMQHFVPAMDIIETHGYGFLQASEAAFIAEIARDCRKRHHFVEQARGWLNRLGDTAPHHPRVAPETALGLTPTELGVLKRLPASTSNKALALALGISESTIKFHLKNIYRKLGVHKRLAAIDVAQKNGLV